MRALAMLLPLLLESGNPLLMDIDWKVFYFQLYLYLHMDLQLTKKQKLMSANAVKALGHIR
jgi:hypothetical protein